MTRLVTWLLPLTIGLLTLGGSISRPQAAYPGLPFVEDFADDMLRDGTQTTARWAPGGLRLQPRQPTYGTFSIETPGRDILFGMVSSMAMGDVDGDGDLDLVGGHFGWAPSLYRNNGTSSPFDGVSEVDIGQDTSGAVAVALGDVDGDGDLDLVTGNSNQPTRLYLNNGTLDPWAGVTVQDVTAEVHHTARILLDDVDGDHDLDLIVGTVLQTNRLYLNNGTADPWWGASSTAITADLTHTLSMSLGDVDADGDKDLVVGCLGSPTRLYRNNGTADPWGGATGSDITSDITWPVALALGDLDGDGDIDLVTGNVLQPNRLYFNNGTADPWNGVTSVDLDAFVRDVRSLAVGDVDRDGDLDLATGTYGEGNRLHLNNGTASPFDGVVARQISADLGETVAVLLGDFDRDGDLDIAAGNETSENRLYLNGGTANPFQETLGYNISNDVAAITDLKLADVDLDGDLDAVVARAGQAVRYYLNNGTADPWSGVVGVDIPGTIGHNGGIAVANMEFDRRPELVTVVDQHTVFCELPSAWCYWGLGSAPDASPSDVVVAAEDFNRDGRLELLIRHEVLAFKWKDRYLGEMGFPGIQGPHAFAAGDVDRDGDLDLVLGHVTGPSRLYLNNGTSEPWVGVPGTDIGADIGLVVSLALGDVDRDGDLDLVAGRNGQTNRLYLNNGTVDPFVGVVGSDITSEVAATRAVMLDDADKDGDLDLVVANADQRSRLFLNNGSGNPWLDAVGFDISSDLSTVTEAALGDIDRDGDLDLVIGNIDNASRYYTNHAGRIPVNAYDVSDITLDGAQSPWPRIALGDVDGDGTLDLVLGRHQETTRLYLNNGTPEPWAGVIGSDISGDQRSSGDLELGDVDGDRDLDLVTSGRTQPMRLYLNNGTSQPFAGVTGADIPNDIGGTFHVALADMNMDGSPDLAAQKGTGQRNQLFLNNGTSDPFAGVTGLDITSDTQLNLWKIHAEDVDGDHTTDLITSGVKLYINSGYPSDPFGYPAGQVVWSGTIDFATADMDLDGDRDLVLPTGEVIIREPEGAPFFTGATYFSPGPPLAGGVATGDLDRDGDADVVVGHEEGPNRVHLNHRAATNFPAFDLPGSSAGWTYDVLLGDVDRDGSLDIVTGPGAGRPIRLHRPVAHDTSSGRGVSWAVDDYPGVIRGVALTADVDLPPNTRVEFWVTNNGGARWLQLRPGGRVLFPSPGSDLRWRAELHSLSPRFTPKVVNLALDRTRAPGDRVWLDIDGNGLQDAGEGGLEGAVVELLDINGDPAASAASDILGHYALDEILAPGETFSMHFTPPPGYIVTPADRGGDDTLDSDADAGGYTPWSGFAGDPDGMRWDAGMYPACMPPDLPIVITEVRLTTPGQFSLLTFQDTNWASRITGYVIRRSTDAALPKAGWPIVAMNVTDADPNLPDNQWIDTGGSPPLGSVWYYEVTGYNARCPAEGPF